MREFAGSILQDLRYALRRSRSDATSSVLILMMLGLSVGGLTAVFSLLNAVFLKPLDYPHSDRLVLLREKGRTGAGVSFLNYADWKKQNHVFENMALLNSGRANLTGVQDPARVEIARISASFFSVFGLTPIEGRLFLDSDEQPNAPPVAILSEPFWRRQFGAAKTIVGRSVRIDEASYSIAGIVDPGPAFHDVDLWIPLRRTPELLNRQSRIPGVAYARLENDIDLNRVQTEMHAISSRLERAYPSANTNWSLSIEPLRDVMVAPARKPLFLLFGAAIIILFLGCGNAATILQARGARRKRELGIRMVFGASARRIVRQVLSESLLLAFGGGAAGLLVATWGVSFLSRNLPTRLPAKSQIAIDVTILGFSLAASLFAGLLSGLAPAIFASRSNFAQDLKEGGIGATGPSRKKRNAVLAISEIALAAVSLIVAGLLLTSLIRLVTVNPGFRARNAFFLEVNLPASRYPTVATKLLFYAELVQGIEGLPGVESVGMASEFPLQGVRHYRLVLPDHQATGMKEVTYSVASPGYFRAMGIPVLKGRNLTVEDKSGAPRVVVISRTAWRSFWQEEDPIGREIRFGMSAQATAATVVGVVGDVKRRWASGYEETSAPQVYAPYEQDPTQDISAIVVRAEASPGVMISELRRQLWSVDKNLPPQGVQTMENFLTSVFAPQRQLAYLFGVFAALALVLAGLGVYGVMSHLVASRRQEMGVRLALGASRARILCLVVGDGLKWALVGIVLGCVLAAGLSRVLESSLYGITPTDPLTYGMASSLLLCVAMTACYFPARRASRSSPMDILRYE